MLLHKYLNIKNIVTLKVIDAFREKFSNIKLSIAVWERLIQIFGITIFFLW